MSLGGVNILFERRKHKQDGSGERQVSSYQIPYGAREHFG